MGVAITDLRFYNEFRSEYTNYLLGNVGDKIRIETTIKLQTTVLASASSQLIMNRKAGLIGDGWIYDAAGRFRDFNIGDTVQVTNYVAHTLIDTRTIINKENDKLIQLDTDVASYADDDDVDQVAVTVSTPITAIKYLFNFIENKEQLNFLSKVDGSEQGFFAKDLVASVTTPVAMELLGPKTWQIGSATIEGVSLQQPTAIDYYTSTFKIKHYTYITPFMLATQWEDLLQNIAPDYLRNEKSFKFVTRISGMSDYNNPNVLQVSDFYKTLGNVGWFGENFNQGPSKYFLSGLTFKNADAETISAIELTTEETDVEFYIENTDAPFSNNNTKFTLNFCKAPATEAEYTGNALTMAQNFVFDRKNQTVGSAAANGDNYGGDYQVLKSVTGTFVNSSKIKITCKIAMPAGLVSSLSAEDDKRYMLFVAVQKHSLDTDSSDRATLLVSSDDFYENFANLDMVQILNVFLRHPNEDPDLEGEDTLDVFPEDEILGRSVFYIDKADFVDGDTVKIRRADIVIKAKNTVTGESFDLQRFMFDMSTLTILQGAQYVDTTIDRNFHIPLAQPFRQARILRRLDLDNDDKYYYNIDFPFLWGWEYWEVLKLVNEYFFDIAESQNGFNKDWTHYKAGDWKIYYACQLRVEKNGHTSTYEAEDELTPHTYNSNSDYPTTSIKSYDVDTDTELYDGGTAKKYILGYKDTKIVAKFTKTGAAPDVDDYAMNVGIEAYEQGGTFGRRRLSTVWANTDGDTWFKSSDASNKVVLTAVGQDIIGTLKIDYTKIPVTVPRYKITARLYDLTVDNISGKITEDGVFKLTEDDLYTKVLE